MNEFGPLDVAEGVPTLKAFNLDSGPWDLAFVTADGRCREGLHFIAALKRVYPRQRVCAIAWRANIPHVESVLKRSITISIAKESTPEEMAAAVRGLSADGLRVIETSRRLKPELSPRELDVLRLVGSGKSVKEVAKNLNVSANTVSTYRSRLLRKLELSGTADLILYALRNKLVD